MALCDKIGAGQDPCTDQPGTAGLETLMYAFNDDEMSITYDAQNPLIITGLTAINGGHLYRIKGFGDSFDAMSKLAQKAVGPRYAETITAQLNGNSTGTKTFIYNASAGRTKWITISNDKTSDGAIQLFGAVNGLKATENTQWQATDEDLQGGWKLELSNPKNTLEAYPPRALAIPPAGQGAPPATYASTIAALEALVGV